MLFRSKELKRRYAQANIVAVDYDPGASEVNQVNRIKLMMSVAHENARAQAGATADAAQLNRQTDDAIAEAASTFDD